MASKKCWCVFSPQVTYFTKNIHFICEVHMLAYSVVLGGNCIALSVFSLQ